MRKRGLFIGHEYHDVTRSSKFFQDILVNYFNLDNLSVNPKKIDETYQKVGCLNLKDYDFVVLWQIDWLAAYFLCHRVKTIVIPMYDASGSLGVEHWRAMRGALFISFSIHLHRNIVLAGGSSCYVRYFPKLSSNPSYFHEVKVFFWERRPDTHINFEKIARLLNNHWDSMHVHQFPDPGLVSSIINQEYYNYVTISNRFDNSEDYINVLNRHNVYIAPRYSEGIGMGFLEAMASGQLVIAHDSPTHNEYITNFKNGILFNALGNDSINLNIDLVHEIQKNVYVDAEKFRNSWLNHYICVMMDAILEYLDEGIDSDFVSFFSEEKDALILLKSLLYAHNDMDSYLFNIKLYNTGFIYDEEKPFSRQALNYELCGRQEVLLNSLDVFIDRYGEDSPFSVFKRLLIERCFI